MHRLIDCCSSVSKGKVCGDAPDCLEVHGLERGILIMIDCAHVAWQTANNPTVNDHGNVIKATKHINLSVISASFGMRQLPPVSNGPSARPLRILVIGAGVGGISVARGLLRDGHHVTVFERRPDAAGGWRSRHHLVQRLDGSAAARR